MRSRSSASIEPARRIAISRGTCQPHTAGLMAVVLARNRRSKQAHSDGGLALWASARSVLNTDCRGRSHLPPEAVSRK